MLFFFKKSPFCDRGRPHFAATLNIILGQVPDNAKPMSTRMFLDGFCRGFLESCSDIMLILLHITQHIVLVRISEGIWKTNSLNLE